MEVKALNRCAMSPVIEALVTVKESFLHAFIKPHVLGLAVQGGRQSGGIGIRLLLRRIMGLAQESNVLVFSGT